jgi:hypothetical protein
MKTIRSARVGKLILRLVENKGKFIGVIIDEKDRRKAKIEGDGADDVWCRLHDEAGKLNPKYFGFDGAIARFRHFFPQGFHSSWYEEQERNYKLAAKTKLDLAVPVEAAAIGSGLGEAILSVYRATNLLSPFETVRLQDVLRGPGADAFVKAAARFALGDTHAGLRDMEHALKPHESAKWTVVTYLPFLWQPETHMFLKPQVTRDFAGRVGHRFAADYQPRLAIDIYESLLDLSRETTARLASLRPRDRIDVQSFIWVVGGYPDDSQEPGARMNADANAR